MCLVLARDFLLPRFFSNRVGSPTWLSTSLYKCAEALRSGAEAVQASR
jgi:hypothetical protein